MKKLALMALNAWLSYLPVCLQAATSLVFVLGVLEPVRAAEFFCASGNVTCLIAAINNANGRPGDHVISLEPGIYTLQAVDNTTDGANGLPSIMRSIHIQASADDPPTVIERDPAATTSFRIFHISTGGNLTLSGLTVQRGGFILGPAILNFGVTSLQDSIVTNNIGDEGAINNLGTLNVFKSVITDNGSANSAGGILNETAGTARIEFSTIAYNGADGSGGIFNRGAMVVRNSSIIFNDSVGTGFGAGIGNTGHLEIINSTVAKNSVLSFGGLASGGGIGNLDGFVSITNSTIRENQAAGGGGMFNLSGTLLVQNSIVEANVDNLQLSSISPNCLGTIASLGNNLVGDQTGCDINLQPSDLTGDPGLGALVGTGEDDLPGRAYYPVLTGSPVINKGNPNACLQTDQLGNLRAGVCDIGAVEFRGPMLVSVDVRPKKDANRINPSSVKKINVAIFSINGFDATAVNPKTVHFGATGTEAAAIRGVIRDVDGDGSFDMVLTFEIQDTGIRCGDTSASLTGKTSQGLSIIGSSPIQTVQCKTQKVARR